MSASRAHRRRQARHEAKQPVIVVGDGIVATSTGHHYEPGDKTLVIEQDHESFDGELGSPMDVFWSKGHGHDPVEFLRAVVDHCLDYGQDIPRIPDDATPVEMWQRNVPSGDHIAYHRYEEAEGHGPRRYLFPVTVLDIERRRSGATKCSVDGCDNPWQSGQPVQVKVDAEGDYLAVTLWLCREHRASMPEPSYRVCLVPVGATIVLPTPDTDPIDPEGQADA